ncbi:hypothetical protein P154DRAFT_247937 [Amniculicola lignicola CBS 123094]|uniref:Uncharacterized protein n=1 Tax=Amniculicola lignicola CBS 123094 TaxID=1392246 RepID=A0A6A5WCF9_9PLEO|nr:hypothetical protein P154DRAFT_247937 [Amniculicola lignicola CBS 123094]
MSTSYSTTTSGHAPTIAPKGSSFAGNEFSNNLFSDLAPLLTLFGEQVTKQFLSMSMGWADNILLGMGPLGIITTVVSAIRVSRAGKLKVLIGRARESPATVEQELLSSTSDNVCELWNGREVVRQIGRCNSKEFIIYHDKEKGLQVGDLEESVERGWLVEVSKTWAFFHKYSSTRRKLSSEHMFPHNYKQHLIGAPNIALNIHGASPRRMELWAWVTMGVVLQTSACVLPGLGTYYWGWAKETNTIPNYAYPLFLCGSFSTILGVILCSHVVEAATIEKTFAAINLPTGEVKTLGCMQFDCNVGDQDFRPYLLWNPSFEIRTSRLYTLGVYLASIKASAATLLTLSGFVCQFVGLRALHWSTSVHQLGVTLAMTAVRSWVRRGLSNKPTALQLDEDADQTALAIALLTKLTGSHPDLVQTTGIQNSFCWEIVTGGFAFQLNPRYPHGSLIIELQEYVQRVTARSLAESRAYHKLSRFGEDIFTGEIENATHVSGNLCVSIREKLRNYTADNAVILAIASALNQAVSQTTNFLNMSSTEGEITMVLLADSLNWTHKVRTGMSQRQLVQDISYSSISLSGQKLNKGVNMDNKKTTWALSPPKSFFPILSLWLHSLDKAKVALLSGLPDPDRLRNDVRTHWNVGGIALESIPRPLEKSRYVRILGYIQDFPLDVLPNLSRWIGKGIIVCPRPDGDSPLHNYPELKVPCWPVFGASQLGPQSSKKNASETFFPYFDVTNAPADNLSGTCLAITSDLPLPNQCALELFSGFWNAAAEKITQLGHTPDESSGSAKSTSLGTFSVASGFIESISQILLDARLVTTLEEAKVIIVPPLARRGLLPKFEGQPDNIIHMRRAKSDPSLGRPSAQATSPSPTQPPVASSSRT